METLTATSQSAFYFTDQFITTLQKLKTFVMLSGSISYHFNERHMIKCFLPQSCVDKKVGQVSIKNLTLHVFFVSLARSALGLLRHDLRFKGECPTVGTDKS